jgi:hypothetical protein
MNNEEGKIVINIELSLVLCFMYPSGDVLKILMFLSYHIMWSSNYLKASLLKISNNSYQLFKKDCYKVLR